MSEQVYCDYQRGLSLLGGGDAHAASVVLERVRAVEPGKASVREALGRAYFNSGRADLAAAEFEAVLAINPVDDYAHYGAGRCALRLGDRAGASRHLKLAAALTPESETYRQALRRLDTRPLL